MSENSIDQERCTLLVRCVKKEEEYDDVDTGTLLEEILRENKVTLYCELTDHREDVSDNSVSYLLKFFCRPDGEKILKAIQDDTSRLFTVDESESSVISQRPVELANLEERIDRILKDFEKRKSAREDEEREKKVKYEELQRKGKATEASELSNQIGDIVKQRNVFETIVKQMESLLSNLQTRVKAGTRVVEKEVLELESIARHELHLFETGFPIYSHRPELIRVIRESQVTIVVGETGCGKSTQLLQYLLRDFPVTDAAPAEIKSLDGKKKKVKDDDLRSVKKRRLFVCCEPRKVVASSLYRRVKEEVGDEKAIAYDAGTVSSRKLHPEDTRVMFTTHHALLTKLVGGLSNADINRVDDYLDNCAVVIVDEAHERTVYSDILIALLRRALQRKPDFKVVIMSATLEPQKFCDYFQCMKPNMFTVQGRTYPVEVEYKPLPKRTNANFSNSAKSFWSDEDDDSYVDRAVQLAKLLHSARLNEEYEMSTEAGILVFLTSPDECEDALAMLAAQLQSSDREQPRQQRLEGSNYVGYYLHGEMDPKEQQTLFEKVPGKRKIVFATNVAETSVTIPEIRCVIDCGLSKQKRYDPRRNTHVLDKRFIARSAADQRKGRAGRTATGVCVRLYAKEEYEKMRESEEPEIVRTNLGSPLLLLLRMGITVDELLPNYTDQLSSTGFRFIQPPEQEAIVKAVSDLERLGAYDSEKKSLTEHGEKMTAIVIGEIEPESANLVLRSLDKNLAFAGCAIASMLSIQHNKLFLLRGSRERNSAQRSQTLPFREVLAKIKAEFVNTSSDMITLLNVFWAYLNVEAEEARDTWCRNHRIASKHMRQANETFNRLSQTLFSKLNVQVQHSYENSRSNNELLRRMIFETYAPHVAKLQQSPKSNSPPSTVAEYVRCDQRTAANLHYSSLLGEQGTTRSSWPNWIVFESVLELSGGRRSNFLINCTEVDRQWLAKPPKHLRKALAFLKPLLGNRGVQYPAPPLTIARFLGRDRNKLIDLLAELRSKFPDEQVDVQCKDGMIVIDGGSEQTQLKVAEIVKLKLQAIDPTWTPPAEDVDEP